MKKSQPAMLLVALVVLFWLGGLLYAFINDSRQKKLNQEIIACYYKDAVAGKVPMPIATNAIRVIRKESGARPTMINVVIVSGETNRFHLIRPTNNSDTNWHFR